MTLSFANNLDEMVKEKIGNNVNLSVSHFIMSSFMYYKLNDSYVSDATFDWICQTLITNWDNIQHPHKHLINREDLEAGSGYAVECPPVAICSLIRMLKDNKIKFTDPTGDIHHYLKELKPVFNDKGWFLRYKS